MVCSPEPRTIDLINLYLSQLPKVRFSREEEAKLARRTKRGPEAKRKEARDKLAESILPMAVQIAGTFQGRGLPMEDLIGAANLGVMRAVDGFNPKLGWRLTTYAYFAIWRELQRETTVLPHAINLPTWMSSPKERVKKMRDNGRHVEAVQQMASLDTEWRMTSDRVNGEFEANPHNVLGEDSHPFDFDADERDSQKARIFAALATLPEKEQQVIRGRMSGLGLREIGLEMKLTKERVRQIEMKAVAKLRGMLGGNTGA